MRNLVRKPSEIQIGDYVACTEGDEELMEVLPVLTIIDDRVHEEDDAKDAANGEDDAINTFHNALEWDESQEAGDIFTERQIANDESSLKYFSTRSGKTYQDMLFYAQSLSTPIR